ncbi:hypothetical protein [Amycolatopsis vancoresmycina]|nr:hypothetical protein [Amycolatopsis vancoresmycina]
MPAGLQAGERTPVTATLLADGPEPTVSPRSGIADHDRKTRS